MDYPSASHLHSNHILEENLKVLNFISNKSQYTISLAEVNAISVTSEIEEICCRRRFDNHAKQLLNTIHQICLSIKSVYDQLGLQQVFQIFHRIILGSCNMSAVLLQQINQLTSQFQSKIQQCSSIQRQAKSNSIVTLSAPKKQTKCLENSELETANKLGLLLTTRANEHKQLLKKGKEEEKQSYEEYKTKIYKKMFGELEQAEKEIYLHEVDEVSTFLLFEKKYLEAFQHNSRSEDLKELQMFFSEAVQDANKFIKSLKAGEETSGFKIRFDNFLSQIKDKKQTRDKELAEKFEEIKRNFYQKKQITNDKISQKFHQYETLLGLKNGRVEAGTNTSLREIKSLKVYERTIQEMKEQAKVLRDAIIKEYSQKISQIETKNYFEKQNLLKAQQKSQNLQKQYTKLLEENKELQHTIVYLKSQNNSNGRLIQVKKMKDGDPQEERDLNCAFQRQKKNQRRGSNRKSMDKDKDQAEINKLQESQKDNDDFSRKSNPSTNKETSLYCQNVSAFCLRSTNNLQRIRTQKKVMREQRPTKIQSLCNERSVNKIQIHSKSLSFSLNIIDNQQQKKSNPLPKNHLKPISQLYSINSVLQSNYNNVIIAETKLEYKQLYSLTINPCKVEYKNCDSDTNTKKNHLYNKFANKVHKLNDKYRSISQPIKERAFSKKQLHQPMNSLSKLQGNTNQNQNITTQGHQEKRNMLGFKISPKRSQINGGDIRVKSFSSKVFISDSFQQEQRLPSTHNQPLKDLQSNQLAYRKQNYNDIYKNLRKDEGRKMIKKKRNIIGFQSKQNKNDQKYKKDISFFLPQIKKVSLVEPHRNVLI